MMLCLLPPSCHFTPVSLVISGMEDRGCGLGEISASTGPGPAPASWHRLPVPLEAGLTHSDSCTALSLSLKSGMRQPLTTAVSLGFCTDCTHCTLVHCVQQRSGVTTGPGQLVASLTLTLSAPSQAGAGAIGDNRVRMIQGQALPSAPAQGWIFPQIPLELGIYSQTRSKLKQF